MSRLKTSLPETLAASVKTAIAEWQSGGKMKRLWDRDASLWTGADESNWLGWLDIIDEQIAQQDQLQTLAKEIQTRGFKARLAAWNGGIESLP